MAKCVHPVCRTACRLWLLALRLQHGALLLGVWWWDFWRRACTGLAYQRAVELHVLAMEVGPDVCSTAGQPVRLPDAGCLLQLTSGPRALGVCLATVVLRLRSCVFGAVYKAATPACHEQVGLVPCSAVSQAVTNKAVGKHVFELNFKGCRGPEPC